MNIEDIIKYIGSAPNDELEMIIRRVNTIRDNRANQRKKELWGNVVAAIRKYEQEITPISLYYAEGGEYFTIDEIESDNPGGIDID